MLVRFAPILLLLALGATPCFAPPGPTAPGPTTGAPSVPELTTGSLGSGILVLVGAALVFVDHRRRRLQEAPASRRNDKRRPE